MSDILTLKPGEYGKLGIIHCGVIGDFTVACAGDLQPMTADGDEYEFTRAGVKAVRKGDEVTFSRLAA